MVLCVSLAARLTLDYPVHFNEIQFVAISCFYVNSVTMLNTTPIDIKYTVIYKRIKHVCYNFKSLRR